MAVAPMPVHYDLEEIQEHFMSWLRDARAMEEQAETMLSAQIGRLEHYPHLKAKMQEHLEETRRQSNLVKAIIERRGGDTSALKEFTAKTVAMAQGLSGMFVGDEVVKGVLASYTFEHMEIASYRILVATAELVGDEDAAETCRAILEEEEAMAAWLAAEMPNIAAKFLKRDAIPGVEAKR